MYPGHKPESSGSNSHRSSKRHKQSKSILPEDITVAIFCALTSESVAVRYSLDESYDSYPTITGQQDYVYNYGRIGDHNVVIARPHQIGPIKAAQCAATVAQQFPNVRFALMIGIGGGIPSAKVDIRLGDIAVGIAKGSHPGVMQYDYGKYEKEGKFTLKGSLNKPPGILLSASSALEEDEEMNESRLYEFLDDITRNKSYARPKAQDILYHASFQHINEGQDCAGCLASNEVNNVISRHSRNEEVKVHRGLILSGSGVIKNTVDRESLCRGNKDAICYEMEAAGIVDQIPCLVIRGICDYADTHKSDIWHRYAAAVAAAYGKAILSKIHVQEIEMTMRMRRIIDSFVRDIKEVKDNVRYLKQTAEDFTQGAFYVFRKTCKDRDYLETVAFKGHSPMLTVFPRSCWAFTGRDANVPSDRHWEQILNWLQEADWRDQFFKYFGEREPGTCQWFLESDIFQQWLKEPKSSLLCSGPPGAGKTILASVLVDHLDSKILPNLNIDAQIRSATVFVFFNIQEKERQNSVHVFTSMLRQLIEQRPSVIAEIEAFYDAHKNQPVTSVHFKDISTAFLHACRSFTRVFVILDALDESEDALKVIPELLFLQTQVDLRLLATSRREIRIETLFARYVLARFSATEQDIRRYLTRRICSHAVIQDVSQDYTPEVKKELEHVLVERIINAADGIFLLARFHTDTVMEMTSPCAMRDAADALPRRSEAYGEIYSKTIRRIESQSAFHRSLAQETLKWLICAQESLTISALRCALTTKIGLPSLDDGYKDSTTVIVEVCKGLVIVDQGGRLRLLHHTAREYLSNNFSVLFDRTDTLTRSLEDDGTHLIFDRCITHREFALKCVTYLSFDVFDCGPLDSYRSVERRLTDYPFYYYAAKFWGTHLQRSGQFAPELIKHPVIDAFIQHRAKLDASWEALYYYGLEIPVERFPKRTTGLHLASFFGIPPLLDDLLGIISPDATDDLRRTPLFWAAHQGHSAVIAPLLSAGAGTDARDHEGFTPLLLAASKGKEEVILSLIEGGADIEAMNEKHERPLMLAAENGHEGAVRQLLRLKANIEAVDDSGYTALLCACSNDHADVVNVLLDGNANIHVTTPTKSTTFMEAVYGGSLEVAKLLLQRGAHVNVMDLQQMTPLTTAIRRGFVNVIKFVIDNHASPEFYRYIPGFSDTIDLSTEGLWDAISLAAEFDKIDALRFLLSRSAESDISHDMLNTVSRRILSPSYTRTQLGEAIQNSNVSGADWLLRSGISPNDMHCGVSYLTQSVLRNHIGFVKLLLQYGADVEAKGLGEPPLLASMIHWPPDIASLVLDAGADINVSHGPDSDTPFMRAYRLRHAPQSCSV
ncbi:ankyrin repeat protein [Fusarium circinatum]|uniref:Ankyrin repeat protein n=1 Tax=Fusarium circinatum TaxID=48490 RepID=A0A8H5WF73_FUSCI|nr:ankyrin repeat protein [Fusarium circinatum]